VEHFARISVERSEALQREAGARHRAEEDLQVSRTLLDRSMQKRVQLGRDLHDNICQTLYAVSLSLEGVRRTVADSAPERQSRASIDASRSCAASTMRCART